MHWSINDCRVAQLHLSTLLTSPLILGLLYTAPLLLDLPLNKQTSSFSYYALAPPLGQRHIRVSIHKCLIKCDCGLSLFNYHVLVYVVVLIQYLSNSRDADTNDRENRVRDRSFIVISLPVADYNVPAHDSSIWCWRCATRWLPFLGYNSYPTTVTCCHPTTVLNNVLIRVCVGPIIAKQNSALALPRWTEIY